MGSELRGDLRRMLEELQRRSPVITTIANGNPNRIVTVDGQGVWISTDASDSKGAGPQLVPAWMLHTAWEHLTATRSLTNRYLLAPAGLNVKRSSAVCALLARLPGVEVAVSRPIELRYQPPGNDDA